jgi:prepilin-type N-terminal cleavage/methylation domain-containing protein
MRATRGFTLLELVVVVCIVAIAAAKLLHWLLYYQEQAEKAVMESTVAAMQSGLTLRASALLIRGTPADINALNGRNPMEWLAERPASYVGAYLREPPQEAGTGIWFFDISTATLVYRPQRRRYLRPGPDGSYDLRFRAEAEYGVERIGAVSGAQAAGLRHLRVAPVYAYSWFEGASPPVNIGQLLQLYAKYATITA